MANNYLGKISIVVFLTVLIWVWADLAQDERLALSNVATLSVAKSSDPALWLSFEGENGALRSSVALDNIDLKGPGSRVADVDRMRNKGELDAAMFLVPEQEGFTETGTRTLNVLNFLRRSDAIRQLGLTVEDCEPKTLTVQIRQLVEKSLPVECVDENGVPLKAEVEPSAVRAFVPDEVLVAKVTLRSVEHSVARTTAIQKTPYVELAPGQRRDVATKVAVTLPAADELKDAQVPATLGFCFSPNLQGKYRVVLDNDPVDLANVLIKATPVAEQDYARAPYQMILYVYDEDRQASEMIRRQVVFSFPEDSVRRDEIKPDQSPPEARFRLEPIPAPAEEAPGS